MISNYHDIKRMSNSGLQLAAISFADYQNWLIEGTTETEAMVFGTITHSKILENKEDFVRIPESLKGKNKNTKAYKEWKAEQTLPIISDDDYEMLMNMQCAIRNHENGRKIINKGIYEKEVLFEYRGWDCKAKMDNVCGNIIRDLKTIREITPYEVSKAMSRYKTQAAFYILAMVANSARIDDLFGLEPERKDWSFEFVFIEKKKPYKVLVVRPSEGFIEEGIERINSILDEASKQAKHRLGYSEDVLEWKSREEYKHDSW